MPKFILDFLNVYLSAFEVELFAFRSICFYPSQSEKLNHTSTEGTHNFVIILDTLLFFWPWMGILQKP